MIPTVEYGFGVARACGVRVVAPATRQLGVAGFHRTATHYGTVSFNNVAVDARRRRLWIGQGAASAFVPVYQRAHPGILSFLYKEAAFVDRVAHGTATSSGVMGGVTYRMARARRWVVFTNGRPVSSKRYPPYVLVNIADSRYQRAWARNVVAQARRGGWSGVFADDLGLARPDLSSAPIAFPDAASWRRAVLSFLAGVRPRLHASGLRLIANTSGGVLAPAFHTQLLQYVDGTMDEGWMRHSTRQSEALATGCMWIRQLAEELQSESRRKDFLAELPASATDIHAIVYGLATFLLGADGYSTFDVAGDPHYANAIWVSEFDVARKLGMPVGSFQLVSGTWIRHFRHGIVLVNPTRTRHTIRLGTTYSSSGTVDAPPVTLPPASGALLLRGPRALRRQL